MDLLRRFSVILPLRLGYWAALTLVLGFACYSVIDLGGQSKRTRMRGELTRIVRENQLLEHQNQQMALEIDALKNRWDYLEKVAREDLGLVRRGELIYQIAQPSPRAANQPAPPKPASGGEHAPVDGPGEGRGDAQEHR